MIIYYSVNGKLVPKEEAVFGVSDLSIQRGYGLFDYFLVKKGRPVFFDDYLNRMERSAEMLRLSIPCSREALKQQIMQLIQANGLQEAGIKLVITGGYSLDGYSPAKPNLVIIESPMPVYPKIKFEDGVKLMAFEYHRTFPSAKTINYIVGINLLPEMHATGAEDILFHSNGNIYETTRANFFIVKTDGTIVTAGDGILMGVTRGKTIEVAKHYFKIEERDLKFSELETASEAFITSSTRGIMAVVKVDDLTIGNGKPGEVTKKLSALLEKEVEEYLNRPII